MKIRNLSNGQEDMFLLTIDRMKDTNLSDINILVDSGRSGNRCLNAIEKLNITKLDYIVLTHIDNDHIKGLIAILKNYAMFNETVIVYNKFVNGLISYHQAETFEKLIRKNEVVVSYKEYQDNSGEITFLSVSQRRKLMYEDDNKVYFTFLSPDRNKVQNLYDYYEYYKRNGKKRSDDAEIVNRSSIMFILEYHKHAILMTGDGYIADIIFNIKQLADASYTRYPIDRLDLIKLSHHGSDKNNNCLAQLLNDIPCDKFVITNENDGSVKISENMKEILLNKTVYVSGECDKFDGIDYVVNREIEV